MRLPTVAFSLLTVALAHSTHHSEQQASSQERLDELEKKWGIDVS